VIYSEILSENQSEKNCKGNNNNDNSYCNSINETMLIESSSFETSKLFKNDSNTQPVDLLAAERSYLSRR